MDNVFLDALHDFITVYLDDILIVFKNIKEHIEHIWFALEKLKQHNLKAKMKNSGFGIAYLEYLRHIVSCGTVSVDPTKIAVIEDWPAL